MSEQKWLDPVCAQNRQPEGTLVWKSVAFHAMPLAQDAPHIFVGDSDGTAQRETATNHPAAADPVPAGFQRCASDLHSLPAAEHQVAPMLFEYENLVPSLRACSTNHMVIHRGTVAPYQDNVA